MQYHLEPYKPKQQKDSFLPMKKSKYIIYSPKISIIITSNDKERKISISVTSNDSEAKGIS